MVNDNMKKLLLADKSQNKYSDDDKIQMGAVYFRGTNPPEEDWERDYKVAKEDGHNIFRHWFTWNAINIAPGKYNWDAYDRQLDLAAKYGIKTIIAEFIADAPEWLYHMYPEARIEYFNGQKSQSNMHISCATGGTKSMCLDNAVVAEAAEEFLKTLALRYKDHPGLYAYDIWNECSLYSEKEKCYCPQTQEKFRSWLKNKYNNDLEKLAKTWGRHSLSSWDQVYIPRKPVAYADFYDSTEFYNDSVIEWMQFRYDILKKYDPNHYVAAHGNSRAYKDISPAAGDDFRSGEVPEIYGYTYWYGNECELMLASDLIRSASKGKEFWRAEAVGKTDWELRNIGDDWHQEKDMMSDPKEIRIDCLASLATGSRGYINPRWRSLLDGPLFGAYGWYANDGSRTERSEMVKDLAQWANSDECKELWETRPIKGEIAILLLEESQAGCYGLTGTTDIYSYTLQGSYAAFKESNIQCDIIKIDQIDDYDTLYVPYPIAIKDEKMAILKKWVSEGGNLICEAAFGYFNEHFHCYPAQPSRGFEEVFGCKESDVSFAPDRWNGLKINSANGQLSGGVYYQSYEPTTGTVMGRFEDGSAAIIDNTFGKGKTRVIGTIPGYAYKTEKTEESRRFFHSLVDFAGKKPYAKVLYNKDIVVRITADSNSVYAFVMNFSGYEQSVNIEFSSDILGISEISALRDGKFSYLSGNVVQVTVAGKDAQVLKLQ